MRRFSIGSAVLAASMIPGLAVASFGLIDTINLGTDQSHGITTDGTKWYVGAIWENAWDEFDSGFVFLTTTFIPGCGEVRGLSYDPDTGHMFVGDYQYSQIHETDLTATILNSWPTIGSQNAVAVNLCDGTIWVASYSQGVAHYDKQGLLLGSFATPGLNWTGLAIDPCAETLLLWECGDLVYEYDWDGNQVGIPISYDPTPDNGQGLYYDHEQAKLFATDQYGMLYVFFDPDRPTCTCGGCPEDVNGDGTVDVLDLLAVIAAWGNPGGPEDVNEDGVVDVLDLLAVISAWGPC
jgi:DNA-binding beta-propeller fold protein YncE